MTPVDRRERSFIYAFEFLIINARRPRHVNAGLFDLRWEERVISVLSPGSPGERGFARKARSLGAGRTFAVSLVLLCRLHHRARFHVTPSSSQLVRRGFGPTPLHQICPGPTPLPETCPGRRARRPCLARDKSVTAFVDSFQRSTHHHQNTNGGSAAPIPPPSLCDAFQPPLSENPFL